MWDYLPGRIPDFLLILLAVNSAASAALLVLDLSLQPKCFRAGLIILAGLALVLALLQIATGYYFTFDAGGTAPRMASVIAYIALMALTVSGKKMVWRLNRIVGVFGLGVPILMVALSPGIIVVGALVIFGLDKGNPIFQGRITPTLSYRVTIINGGDLYQYSLLLNPTWLPLVRKEVSEGPIYSCHIPALQVSLDTDARKGFVRVACRQKADTLFTGEIPVVDDGIPGVFLRSPNGGP